MTLSDPDPGFKVTVGNIGDFLLLSRQYLKTVEARIMLFSPYSSHISLVFQEQVLSRNFRGSPERER